jgi:hypothetical protein
MKHLREWKDVYSLGLVIITLIVTSFFQAKQNEIATGNLKAATEQVKNSQQQIALSSKQVELASRAVDSSTKANRELAARNLYTEFLRVTTELRDPALICPGRAPPISLIGLLEGQLTPNNTRYIAYVGLMMSTLDSYILHVRFDPQFCSELLSRLDCHSYYLRSENFGAGAQGQLLSPKLREIVRQFRSSRSVDCKTIAAN